MQIFDAITTLRAALENVMQMWNLVEEAQSLYLVYLLGLLSVTWTHDQGEVHNNDNHYQCKLLSINEFQWCNAINPNLISMKDVCRSKINNLHLKQEISQSSAEEINRMGTVIYGLNKLYAIYLKSCFWMWSVASCYSSTLNNNSVATLDV